MKPSFNKKRIEKLLQLLFSKSKIISYTKFKQGLVSPTYKVNISKPKKTIVVKLSKKKNIKKVHQNNLILNYLNRNRIPSPKVFYEGIFDKKYITIMEYSRGEVAYELYEKASPNLRKNILKSAGINLMKIHKLKIPKFWVHQHHEVKNQKQWMKWVKKRIEKYLKFSKKKLPKYLNYLKRDLKDFYLNLENQKPMHFVSLHWDYHLSNINVDNKGQVTGIFDFDNCMKGHNLADIGQTAYWIRFKVNDYKNFRYFLKGYGKRFTKAELKLIRGYFLLHLLAVTRTIWYKQPRLTWIIKEHKKILDEFVLGVI